VLWPCERIFAVLSQAGLHVTLPYLSDLTERWAASGEDCRSPLWLQADELSAHMLSNWPVRESFLREHQAPSDAARMLALLTRLKDTARIDTFLADIAVHSLSNKSDNQAILGALGLLSPHRAWALIEGIIAGTAATSLSLCGDLLARAVAALSHDRRTDLVAAAGALIEALPGGPTRSVPSERRRSSLGVEPGFIVDLFTALGQIDEALAERAADHILAWPKTYDPDTVLVPTVRGLLGSLTIQGSVAVRRLRMTCLEHLRARVAESLEAPRDWSRASVVGCRCPHCGELSRYLADPKRETWAFKAVETHRSHVEATIQQARCDLDVTTDRRGRPYSLVCTKNQASYERRMKQRKEDLADLKRLDV
jgi:hypothetical protein